MHLSDILTPERVLAQIEGNSKKRVLELISNIVAETSNVSSKQIFDALITREKLGSTGLGSGVAIPHARTDLEEPIGCLFVLKDPIDFDAQDEQPVDIIFSLLVPEAATDSHLQLLAQVAELLNDESVRKKMRQAVSHDTLYELIMA